MTYTIKTWMFRLTGAAVVLLLAACGGKVSETPPPPPPPSVGSATVGAAGGSVDGPDGVRLVVPAGALDADVTFRIARDATGAPALQGLNAVSPIYAVTPHGQAFGAQAVLSIPLAAATQLPAGATPMLLKAEPGGAWRIVGRGGSDPARVAADIDGLSFFVLAACTSTNLEWTIGAGECPTDHELRLTMFDGQNQPTPVLRNPNGVLFPLWTVVDVPQTRTFRVTWTRPAGINRVDQVAAVGSPFGFNANQGFASTWPSPPSVSTNGSLTRDFTVSIDPSRVFGATGVNGRIVRVRALAGYSVQAFRIGTGLVTVNYNFEVDIPIEVRFSGPTVTISTPPANVGVVEGQPATFSVVAAATPAATLSYRWLRRPDANAAFTAIAGASQASYTLPATTLADNGAQFQVEVCVQGTTRCVTSAPATLAVTRAPEAPSFTMQPGSLAIIAGQTGSFTAVARGVPAPSIRWQTAAAGSTSFSDLVTASCPQTPAAASGDSTTATCTVGPVATGDNGRRYRALAVNAVAAAGVPSNEATLTVTAAPAAPMITTQPAAQSTVVGGSATFSVVATGTSPLAFTWRLNGTALPGAGNFTVGACTGTVGANGASLTLSGLSLGCNGAAVTVVVGNGISPDATSDPATLTVRAPAPQIQSESGNRTVTVGGNATFSVTATGTDLRYQWFRNGVAIPNATASSYTLSNAQNADNGAAFSVQVCNGPSAGGQCVTSGTMTLTVNAGVNVGPPASVGACFGGQFGWCYVQPAPMANRLTGLAFDSSGSGLTIVGDAGTVLTSTDFGGTVTASWQSQRYAFTDLVSPSPGRLVAAVQDPNDINATGLYLSTDGGSTWSRRAPANFSSGIAFRDALVGVAVGPGEIQRTTDGGDTWTVLNLPTVVPPNLNLTGVAYAGNDVFVAVGILGGVRSTDGGLTWSALPRVLVADPNLSSVAFNGQGVGLAMNGSQPVAARSTDFGASWNTVTLPFVATRAAFGDAGTVVILGGDSRHARSEDGGLTWSPEAFSLQIGQQDWRPYMRNAQQGIAVGDYGAIARTEDGGQTWSEIAGGNINRTTWAIEANPSRSVLLAQINGALSRSTDGRTWTDVSGGNWTTTFRQSISWGSDTVAVAATTFEGVQITANAGDTWTRIRPPFATGTYPAAAMANAQTVVVAGYNVVNGVVESFVDRSTDAGQTWSRLNLPGLDGSGITITAVRFVTPTLGFIAGSAGTPGSARLWRTEDAGAIWLQFTLPDIGTGGRRDNIQAIQPGPSGTVFMATDSALLRSADTGFNWSRVLDSSAFGSITDVRFSGTTGIAVGTGGIWRTDNGATWTRLDLPLSGVMLSTAWGPGGLVLAGGDGGALLANQSLGNLAVRPDNPMFRQALRLAPSAAGARAASPPTRIDGVAGAPSAPNERARALLQPPPLKPRAEHHRRIVPRASPTGGAR